LNRAPLFSSKTVAEQNPSLASKKDQAARKSATDFP
jgi:hypothetical protein